MTGNTDMHLLVTDTLKERWRRGTENQTACGVTTICLMHLLCIEFIEFIRLLIVAFGMLSHFSSMAEV